MNNIVEKILKDNNKIGCKKCKDLVGYINTGLVKKEVKAK